MEPSVLLEELAAEIRVCPLCRLCETRTHAVPGSGLSRARLMFVGEGPGEKEDLSGRPFMGAAGQFLDELLERAGIERDDVFITNVVKCFISPRVPIYTSEGYKPIKDIQIGDLVLTHRGHFRPVVYIRPREVLPTGSEVVRLTLRPLNGAGTRPVHLTVTPEHPFFINGEWKPAHQIEAGDRARALGDECEVCGRTHFVRADRYEKRIYRTCCYKCHNRRIYHNPEAREKVRRTMNEQYADLRRDRFAITRHANERVRELVALGEAKLQNLTPQQRQRSRVAVAANVTNGLSRQRCGFGEEELKPIFERLGVDYRHQFGFAGSSFIYDFCLPQHKILIEVRGPGSASGASWQSRAIEKDALAEEHDYLVVNLWWAQIIEHPAMVEAVLERILKNHAGEYAFVDVEVAHVEQRKTLRALPLYNIGVADDESYVAAGIVSHNCRPPKNRDPLIDEVEACSDYLDAQIAIIEPKIICPLGSPALHRLLGPELKISKVRCQVFRQSGILYIPLFHPAAALHRQELQSTVESDFGVLKELINREIREEEITDWPTPEVAAARRAKTEKQSDEAQNLSLF